MRILVCISNVPDTTTKIRLTENNTKPDTAEVQWIINPWDELALTRALELKDAGSVEGVDVINVGEITSEPVIRKALAIGADKAIRVNAEAKDAYFVANQIANAVKDKNYDIILCGIESSDFNGSSVGGMLSELLDIASISGVSSLNIDNNEIICEREITGGKEKISTPSPLLAVVQKGIAINPRIPAMRGIMMARSKPLEVVEAIDSDIFTSFTTFSLPEAKGSCKMIDPENMEELINSLHNEAKVI